MPANPDTLGEVVESVDVVTDASHVDVPHRVVALMLGVVLVEFVLAVQHVLVVATVVLIHQLAIFGITKLLKQGVFLVDLTSRGTCKSAAESDQLVVIRVTELWKLAHSIFINTVAVLDFALIVLVAFTLVLRLIIFLLIVTALIQERWIRVVQDVLAKRSDLFKPFKELFGALVLDRVAVIQVGALGSFVGVNLLHLVVFLLLATCIFAILLSIVVKNLLVRKFGVDLNRFLPELLLLRHKSGLVIGSSFTCSLSPVFE